MEGMTGPTVTSGSPAKGPARILVGLWQGVLESVRTDGTGRWLVLGPPGPPGPPSLSLPPCPVLRWALGDKPEHMGWSCALQDFVEITFCRQAGPGTGRVLCGNNGCIFLGNQHWVPRQLWAGKASQGRGLHAGWLQSPVCEEGKRGPTCTPPLGRSRWCRREQRRGAWEAGGEGLPQLSVLVCKLQRLFLLSEPVFTPVHVLW